MSDPAPLALLPAGLVDLLPPEAEQEAWLAEALVEAFALHGYERVTPPLLEFEEGLLAGSGAAVAEQTFRLMDPVSQRMMGLRADTTPQVARIDAHLLNRPGVTRLCYCGPVLHTRVDRPHATREPLQLGAEIYGHAGLEADLEVLELACASLRAAGLTEQIVDLGDVRVVDALLAGAGLSPQTVSALHSALAAKDVSTLGALSQGLPTEVREALLRLPSLYGDVGVLDEAARCLPASPLLQQALADLRWLAAQLEGVRVSFDLADLRGYAYYTGVRFSLFAAASPTVSPRELLRGGRYDEVGAVFGRKRPAAGFSLDLKEVVAALDAKPLQAAIRAPWGDAPELRGAIAALRARGETVVCVLPGHESEIDEFHCDRELINAAGQWVIQAI